MSNIRFRSSRTLGSSLLTTDARHCRISRNCWSFQSVKWWNMMPEEVRSEQRMSAFRNKLRKWVKAEIPLKF